jgi:hypothetical protein
MSTRVKCGSIINTRNYYRIHERQKGLTTSGDPHKYFFQTCMNCGREFKVYRYYRIRHSAIRFCSMDCYFDYRRAGTPVGVAPANLLY